MADLVSHIELETKDPVWRDCGCKFLKSEKGAAARGGICVLCEVVQSNPLSDSTLNSIFWPKPKPITESKH